MMFNPIFERTCASYASWAVQLKVEGAEKSLWRNDNDWVEKLTAQVAPESRIDDLENW